MGVMDPKTVIRRILKAVTIILLLYVFLVSISLLSAAFKMFGKDFANNLIQTTSNPFVGLFIGILATTLIQSSSTNARSAPAPPPGPHARPRASSMTRWP